MSLNARLLRAPCLEIGRQPKLRLHGLDCRAPASYRLAHRADRRFCREPGGPSERVRRTTTVQPPALGNSTDCPFCPGHESQTPPAVYSREDRDGPLASASRAEYVSGVVTLPNGEELGAADYGGRYDSRRGRP